MNELKFSKRKQTKSNTVTVEEFKAMTGKESDLQSQCENYLTAQQITFTRIPDAVNSAIFGYGSNIPPYIKRLISSMTTGVPDLALHKAIGDTPYCRTLFVELKTKKGKMSLGQKKFRDKVDGNVTICRSFEHFTDLVTKFMEE